jgi:maltose alpha-D-glucosyltransferase/alpha-amylase
MSTSPQGATVRERWYQDAVVYCLDVETYHDANGDGVGDFKGLTAKLDHIAGLGATCLWLLPFYPTPNRDNGYDVCDHYGVDPRLGTLGDFVEFVHAAEARGLRVIVDLVVNHTSDQHPWFQAARQPGSPMHDWYVWRDERPDDHDEGMIFPGEQETVWTYDRTAKRYYLHRFYAHQPDLNIANPAVREEIERVMGFWLRLGVSGFRIDAAPFLIEHKGLDASQGAADPYAYLRQFRTFLSWRRGDAVLLAEANVDPDKTPHFFGDGDRLHLLFHFVLNQHLFLALAREHKEPLARGLLGVPDPPPAGQWATFVRNHDELALGRLTEAQRADIRQALAPDPDGDVWLFNRGPRRRLPPMLGGDGDRIRMTYSLLLSLPGTPVLRYGEEIGMGDDLSLPGRTAVRTPMQWSARANGGFSAADTDNLIRPVISGGEFGYEQVNVDRQRRAPDSLLLWMERAIRARKEADVFGRGAWQIVDTDHPAVFAHVCHLDDVAVAAVHNLSGEAADVTLDLSAWAGRTTHDLLDPAGKALAIDGGTLALELPRYGFRWLRLEQAS